MPGLEYNTRMTCIVGITNGFNVYMGGERSASDGESIISMSRPKIHVREDWIFGYAGNIGTGQLLEMIPLPIVGEDDDPYFLLRLQVVEDLKKAIDSFGDDESDDTDFLIGCKGRLFEFSTDGWGVVEVFETSIGTGTSYALGSLYTSIGETDPERRIELALGAAITYSPTCQGPWDILKI